MYLDETVTKHVQQEKTYFFQKTHQFHPISGNHLEIECALNMATWRKRWNPIRINHFFTHAPDATDAALATDAADAVARTEVWIWSCEFPTQFLSKILNVRKVEVFPIRSVSIQIWSPIFLVCIFARDIWLFLIEKSNFWWWQMCFFSFWWWDNHSLSIYTGNQVIIGILNIWFIWLFR